MRQELMLLIAGAILLNACATVGNCNSLDLHEYDQEFNTRFIMQYEMIPEGSPLDVFVLNEIKLRDEVRACKGEK